MNILMNLIKSVESYIEKNDNWLLNKTITGFPKILEKKWIVIDPF